MSSATPGCSARPMTLSPAVVVAMALPLASLVSQSPALTVPPSWTWLMPARLTSTIWPAALAPTLPVVPISAWLAAEPTLTLELAAASEKRTMRKAAIAAANADLKAQADPNAEGAAELQARYPKAQVRDFDGDPSRITEMDALIAYLQMLGTLVDVEKAAPQDQGDAPVAGKAGQP